MPGGAVQKEKLMPKKKVAKKTVVKTATKIAAKGKIITKEIAQRYVKDSSAVDLETFTALDDKAAPVLSKSDGWLCLNGLTDLSEAAAKGLAQFKGISLQLNGLTEVSDAVARCLAKARFNLELNGLTAFPESLARIMESHSRWLGLNGVASLSDEAARLLSRRKEGRLGLRGVKSVSDTAAKWLATSKDDLELGVEALSDASAKAFASFAKVLKLPNLRTLSDTAAKSLEKLDADGRLEVSDRLCKTMKRLKDHCYRWQGLLKYRGWKLDEKKVKWKEVPDKASKVLHDAFSWGVDHDKVKITRLTLTPPKGGQKQEYFVGDFDSSDMDYGKTYVVNDKAVVAEDESD